MVLVVHSLVHSLLGLLASLFMYHLFHVCFCASLFVHLFVCPSIILFVFYLFICHVIFCLLCYCY